MATFSKVILSGSTNGKGIEITQTATAGDLIHTAVAGAVNMDEVWLWAVNTDANTRILTLEFGGVADPDDYIEITLETQSGAILVCPGLILQNSLVIRAFADAANVIAVFGYVNRITN